MLLRVCIRLSSSRDPVREMNRRLTRVAEFEMLHDDEVIPKYAANIVIGRVEGQTPSLEI